MARKVASRTRYGVVGWLCWPAIKSQCLDGNAEASRYEDVRCHCELEQGQLILRSLPVTTGNSTVSQYITEKQILRVE